MRITKMGFFASLKNILISFKNRKNIKFLITAIILGIFLGLFNFHWLIAYTNNLEASDWRLSFSPSAKIMAYAEPGLRLGLYNEKLFLSSFSKIIFIEEDDLDSISLDFDLREQGTLELILGKEEEAHYVFKLSRYGNIESGFFKAIKGVYDLESDFNSQIIEQNILNRGNLVLNIKDNRFELFVNKTLLEFFRDPTLSIVPIAIRSGVENITVDNIKVRLSNGGVFQEKFESKFKRINFAALFILLSTFFFFGLWLFDSAIISYLSVQKIENILKSTVITYLPILLLSGGLFGFSKHFTLLLTAAVSILILKIGYIFKNKIYFKTSSYNLYSEKAGAGRKILDFVIFFFSKKGLIYLCILFLYGAITALSLRIVILDRFSANLMYLIVPVSLIYSLILLLLSDIKIKSILKYEIIAFLPIVSAFILISVIKRIFNFQLDAIPFLMAFIIFYLVLKIIYSVINAEYFRLCNSLCFITAILIFIALELCIRATHLNQRWRPDWKVNIGMSILAVDSKLFWSPVTMVNEEMVSFRGIEYPIEKSKGITRIICLGDSTTWGQGIEDAEQAYPAILEKLLNWKKEKYFEVINAGVQGYSSFQGELFFKKHILKLNPDIITVRFCANDWQDNLGIGINLTDKEYWEMINPNTAVFNFSSQLQNLLRKSRLYVGLERLIFSLRAKLYLVQPKPRVPVGEYIDNLEGFVEAAKENNIRMLFIYETFARAYPLKELLRNNPHYQGMKMVAEENNIPLVDTVTPFVERRHENLFWDEVHPTALGHKIIAEEIYKVLKKKFL